MNTKPLRESDNRNLGEQERFLLAKVDILEIYIRNLEFAVKSLEQENEKLKEQLMRRYE